MTLLLIVSLFFIAALFGLAAVYMGYVAVRTSPQYELKKRLRKLALGADERLPSHLAIEILHEMTPLDKFLYKSALIRRLDKLIDNAGLKIDVKIFILFLFIGALIGFTLGVLIGRGIILSTVLLIFCGITPLFYLQVMKNTRIRRFTEQFPDALDMIGRSLKAGHSLSGAIQMVGNEMAEPTAGLFKTAYETQTLGLAMRDALSQMAERVQSVDIRLFLAAVSIHREVGGNLAETLDKLAQTIRERIRIRRQVRVYTAQGRLSGYILAALPIFMGLFLYITSPDYLGELVQAKAGKYALGIVATGQIAGFLVIMKLVNIKI